MPIDKCDSSMGKSYNTRLSSRSSTSVKTSPDMATTSVIDIESFRQLLQQELDPMKKDIVTLTNNVQSIQTTLKDVMDTAEKSYSLAETAIMKATESEKRIEKLEEALEAVQIKNTKLHEQTLKIESYSRRDNLRFDGIQEVRGENCETTIQNVISKMKLDRDVDISRVHRLGPYQPGRSTPRPIIVRFLSYPDRESVWSNRSTLKGTRIWLSEDFPNEIDKRRQKLMPYLRAAQAGDSDNPQTRVTANLRQDKLFINNHAYTVNNLASLPMFIKAGAENRACVKKTDDITLFYSGNCHFSNFHLARFEVDGFEYSSAEQYLSFKKAILIWQRLKQL